MAHFLAIDADARGLFVAAGTARNGAVAIDRVAHAADAPPLSPSTAADLGARLRDLLKASGVRPAPVLLCVGRDRVLLKSVQHPPTPPAEEPAVVRFQAVRDLSESPDDVVMDYAPLPPVTAGERRAAAVFARKEVIASARALCEAAGLKLAAITPRPFVAGDLLRRADPATPADTAIGLLTLWPAGGEFTVVRGRDVLFSRAVPPAAAADERGVIADLRRNLTVYAGQFPADPLTAVHVAEPATDREGWADRLGDVFPLPFLKLDPLAGAFAELVPDALRGRFAGPVGLLAAKAAPAALAINFAAPRQPRADANPHRVRILVAALLGILVLGTGAVGGYLEIEKAGRRVASAMAEKAAVDAELQNLEVDSKRLAAAEEFATREVVWLDELYDLSSRVPDVAQMRVTEMDGTALAPPAKPTAKAGQPAPKGPVKPAPVGQMRLVVATENPALVDGLADSFNRDGFYAGTGRASTGLSGAGSKTQQFTITTQVIHRSPADYRRKLAAAPKPPATPEPKPAPATATAGEVNP